VEGTVSESEPKTAYELILERLQKKDREAGVQERPLTDEQRQQILELRKVYEARLAEREILFESARRKAVDPESGEQLEQEYRRDRERIASERDHKIEEVRRSR
jgi:hypothetical protein